MFVGYDVSLFGAVLAQGGHSVNLRCRLSADGKAGTVEMVSPDEDHGLRISIGGHVVSWPISTINSRKSGQAWQQILPDERPADHSFLNVRIHQSSSAFVNLAQQRMQQAPDCCFHASHVALGHGMDVSSASIRRRCRAGTRRKRAHEAEGNIK
jgi:hypothetical protein